MSIDKHYLAGVTAALRDTGICPMDNFSSVVEKVAADMGMPPDPAAASGGAPPAMAAEAPPPGTGMGDEADPEEMADVGTSGLTDKDIESAAKVVQVIAEMKRKSDIQTGLLPPQSAGAQQAAAAGQPPLPPPPQPPAQAGAPVGQ